uniref:Spiroplasma plectrovirus-related protein n=1 Tax=Ascaris lumbricoides TaxID=6252 RepID=A0A0M3IVU3_ASCLU
MLLFSIVVIIVSILVSIAILPSSNFYSISDDKIYSPNNIIIIDFHIKNYRSFSSEIPHEQLIIS